MEKNNQISGNIRDEALYYVSQSLPVIPLCSPTHQNMTDTHKQKCKSPGKTPIIKEWSKWVVTTKEDVLSWFSQNRNLNIGLPLGQNSGIVGLDIDGRSGEVTLLALSNNDILETWEFNTGTGRRLLYSLPKGINTKKFTMTGDKPHEEFSILCDGNQTVLPPSVHSSGRKYLWKEGHSPKEISLAQAPQWVLDQIIVKDDQQQKISPPVTEKDWGGTLYEGQRNEGLARQIGSLVGRGMPKEQVLEFSVIWNNHHCQPPLPQEEVETIVESIFMREKMKQAKKGRTTTEPSQKGFKPTPFIKQFIFHQQEMGYQWKYSVEMGAFFRCDITKGPWQLIDLDYVKREIRLALINEERTGQAKWDSVHCISEAIEAFKAELVASNHCDFFDMGYAIKYGGWERHPLEIISLKNGILEWQTNKLLPWNPKIYTTIQLPVEYDPKADCPTWKEALQSWIGDDTTISFLQEFIGLCLIPDTSFDTAVFLYGVGSNGKSMFLDTVRTLFGNALTAIPLHKLATRFETVYIQNKLVNICGDIDAKYISDTGVLKSIITGDTIEGEFKHGKSFWFTPVCRLMFSANSLPGVSDKTIGWIRRWKFIEFPHTFATNPSYKISHTTMFGKEKNGIFNWALEGLQRLKGNNTWTLSEKMKESESEYRNINDNVSAFLAEVVERVDYDSTQLTLLPVTPLHKYYVEWLDSNINGTQPVSINEFSKRISSNNFTKGIRTVNGKSSNVFFGMRIKEQYLDEYRIWSGF